MKQKLIFLDIDGTLTPAWQKSWTSSPAAPTT